MLEALTTLFLPWSEFYADSSWLPTTVLAVHMLALFIGGGMAIAADRRILMVVPDAPKALQHAAEELQTTHAIVIGALVLTVLSGVALATSDLGTFAVSTVFWAKMATLVVLLSNGVYMQRMESQVHAAASDPSAAPTGAAFLPSLQRPWTALRRSAVISATAWSVMVVLGVVLSNV